MFRDGQWALCNCAGWPDNSSYQNLVAWTWVKDNDRHLIIVNLSDSAAQARVQVPWEELREKTWRLVDVLSGQTYERNGDEMRDPGLYVDLKPWNCYFFRLQHRSLERGLEESHPAASCEVSTIHTNYLQGSPPNVFIVVPVCSPWPSWIECDGSQCRACLERIKDARMTYFGSNCSEP